ncbi:hypothetical protein NEOLEDRAFT_1182070 [Neolentinus lepideus HHB14362 ss-1]|uniref:Uncharacterized protein n=1 Tax=Neolentinus lepideus HHB14362 ss-1 TaxID=1314782 RepID=A0A165PG59_9AGAM|nr:hypothetical protein NEOLEDRAFT_1182070 [Neolentinus lepideus HHB14362 ss-1]
MESLPCKGKDENGKDCTCLRFMRKPNQDPNEPHICRYCPHAESSHPSTGSSIASVLSSYRDPLKLGTKLVLKTSAKDAVRETNTGLKRPAAHSASESHSKKVKAPLGSQTLTHADKPKDKEEVAVGWVVVVPDGLDEDGDLIITSAPSSLAQLLQREVWKLAVSKNRDGSVLAFRHDWDEAHVDEWLRGFFPEVFQFLDNSDHPIDERPWTLLLKSQHALVKYPKAPDGEGLDACKGGIGHSWKQHIIYIASNVTLPFEQYTNGWKETDVTEAPVTLTRETKKLEHEGGPGAGKGKGTARGKDKIKGKGKGKEKGEQVQSGLPNITHYL